MENSNKKSENEKKCNIIQINNINSIRQINEQSQIDKKNESMKQKKVEIKNKKKYNKIKNKFNKHRIGFETLADGQSLKNNKNKYQDHIIHNYHQYQQLPKYNEPHINTIAQKNKQTKFSTNDYEQHTLPRQTHNPRLKKIIKQQQKTIEQQTATNQLLNIQQSNAPNKLNKMKDKINRILYQSNQQPNNKYPNKCTQPHHKKNEQYLHSNSLKKLYFQNRIIESSSQIHLKSSPDKYQQLDRYQTIKNISNFDILKLHAEKLDKSNILMNSHIKDLSVRNSLKIEQEYRHRTKKQGSLVTGKNKIEKLQINFTNRGKIHTELKRNSIIHEPSSSRINLKCRKKSEVTHSIEHNKNINESLATSQNKKNYHNLYKYQQKNQLMKSFTNRSFQYQKNHSMNSYIYQSTNHHDNIDIIDDCTINQPHEHAHRCQQIIRIQDDDAENQNNKFNQSYVKRYRKLVTDPSDQYRNGSSSNEYVINNQFWPMANRAVIDKNRQNIKKINSIYNKIKSFAKCVANSNVLQKDSNINSNQNIDQFIRTKLSLIQNSSVTKTSTQKTKNLINRGLMTCISFNDRTSSRKNHKKQQDGNCQNYYKSQQRQGKSNIQNQNKNKSSIASAQAINGTNSRVHPQKSQTKSQNKTATRFYQPLVEKCKDKANVLIADPYLKTRAMDIGPKDCKKVSDIVIICL